MSRYKPKGWRGDSVRHSLARRGIKTNFSRYPKIELLTAEIHQKVSDKKDFEMYAKELVEAYNEKRNEVSREDIYKLLEKSLQNYRREKIKIKFLTPERYDLLPEERQRNEKGEMSYATTRVYGDGSADIFIRQSCDLENDLRLLRHEVKEIEIYEGLKGNGLIDNQKTAHKLNPVKIRNSQVDKAYGDIGDPI